MARRASQRAIEEQEEAARSLARAEDLRWLYALREGGEVRLEELDIEEHELLRMGARLRVAMLQEDVDNQYDDYWTLPDTEQRCSGRFKLRDEIGAYILGSDNMALTRPCIYPVLRGGTVCIEHGGGAAEVKRKATQQLMNAVPLAVGALVDTLTADKSSYKDKIAAANAILNRAGLRETVNVEIETPQWAHILNEFNRDIRKRESIEGTVVDDEPQEQR